MVRSIPLAIVLIAAFAIQTGTCISAEITAERSKNGVTVKIDGKLFTEYLIQSGNKPILWPIIGPTGKPMTRDFPMLNRDGETKDHPHHRSMWFTHGEVNGENFWLERGKVGTIKHLEFTKVEGGNPAVIVARNAWLAKDGKKVCEDVRTLKFDTDGEARWIDFDIDIKATDGAVKFGDTKEGTFGVRVAETLSVNAKKGGRIINSKQEVDGDAWGKQAPWVDCHGPIDGQTVGIAIFNHPSSFRYPTYWHVRTYGLFTANPFGLHDFLGLKGDKKESGAYDLPSGKTMTLRYRVYFHRGDEKAGKVAEAFSVYSKEGTTPAE
jgi:hypothetical protein